MEILKKLRVNLANNNGLIIVESGNSFRCHKCDVSWKPANHLPGAVVTPGATVVVSCADGTLRRDVAA